MKPKKTKFSLGPGGLKGFLVEHVEKMVLGLVLVVVVLFVYFGTNVETFPQSETPATLEQVVQNANINMESNSWDKVRETLLPPPIDDPIVIRVSEKDFSLRTMDERILPSRTKRRDPELYPPINLEVEAMVAGVSMLPLEDEIVPLDLKYQEMLDRQQALLEPDPATLKKKKKRPGRYGEEDLLDEAARGLGAEAMQTPRVFSEEDRTELMGTNSVRPTNEAVVRTRNIVALKALIPFQKQLLEYQEALAGNPQFVSEERDTPKYVFFKVERADVTDNPAADPTTLQWQLLSTTSARNLPYLENATWDPIPEELVDPSAVIPAVEQFPALTMPVPPAVMVDLRSLAGHSEIAWANALIPGQTGTGDTKKGPMEEGPDVGLEGPESPDQLGPPGSEFTPGVRPAPGVRGGYGRGGGEYSYESNREVVYKLFRFIDFDVERERKYRYRVSLMLEDPNHPQLPQTATSGPVVSRESGSGDVGNDPPIASLDKTVEERLRELKKEEDKTGRRKWYRETDWSEASPVIEVPDPLQFVGGPVNGVREMPIAGTYARVAAGEASAKTLVVGWDDRFATHVVAEEEVQRGSTINFTKDAEALHPIRLEYIELKDYPMRTDAIVVDIRGGERLPGGTSSAPQTSPGQVAVIDNNGKLVILNEFDDLKAWHRYGKVDPIKIEEPKPENDPSSGFYEESRPRRSRGS